MTCSVEGCERKHSSRGWCKKHYERWRTTGTTDKREKPYPSSCLMEDCKKRSHGFGYCKTHYSRLRKQGKLKGLTANKKCSVSGCEQTHYATGLCAMHYSRMRKHGSPGQGDPLRRVQPEQCAADCCDNPARSRSLCEKHLGRLYRLGEDQVNKITVEDPRHLVDYSAVHYRIKAERGKASEYKCAACKDQAFHWAYQHTDPQGEVSNFGGPFSRDTSHYKPMCVSCHRTLDNNHRKNTRRVVV